VKKLNPSVFLAVAVVVVFGFCTSPALAQAAGDDLVLHQQMPVTCIDSSMPEVACFGASVLYSPPSNNPGYACYQARNSCYVGCTNFEISSLSYCQLLSPGTERENCFAIARSTAMACIDQCTSNFQGCLP
jgi:hypothetical protein